MQEWLDAHRLLVGALVICVALPVAAVVIVVLAVLAEIAIHTPSGEFGDRLWALPWLLAVLGGVAGVWAIEVRAIRLGGYRALALGLLGIVALAMLALIDGRAEEALFASNGMAGLGGYLLAMLLGGLAVIVALAGSVAYWRGVRRAEREVEVAPERTRAT